MLFVYNIFLALYKTGILFVSLWNAKAKKWVEGRRNWQKDLSSSWNINATDEVVWMHCASLGEFEQGRPVLEKIKSEAPHAKIIVTFFSPSGYEIRKNYNQADYVMYLPLDSKENASVFLNLVKPKLAIFVKYEFWHYYLQELKLRKIETILVSGIFRASQPFFQWWGGFHRNMLRNFSSLFVQNRESKELLDGIGLANQTVVAGDTRFDRVISSVQQWKPVEHLDPFCTGNKILVAGSTWPEDEQLIAGWFNENKFGWKLIIAPHEIKTENISRLLQLFPDCLLFSEISGHESSFADKRAIIINNIGYLSRIYKYATVCYVGGGFNKSGHHNILEAAVYGKPVITGPNYQKFKESVDLKDMGGSFIVENSNQLNDLIKSAKIEKAGIIAEKYVRENGGATDAIFNWLQEKRLFTKA